MARKPAELVEILKNPKASTFEKAKACQRLAVVGTKDAVPALAALLPDEKLNCYARCGLEGIADPAVDEALRDAATKLHGRQLVGVSNSIGQRRDAKAVELLAKLLDDKDAAVASAAAGALGRIGTPEAAWALREALLIDSPVKVSIADACLDCAEHLGANGSAVGISTAIRLYGLLETGQEEETKKGGRRVDLPKYIKVAARHGFFRMAILLEADSNDLPKDFLLPQALLLDQLRSPDKASFNVGLALAREMPGAGATRALANELKKLPPERRALLLLALADRKEPVEISVLATRARATRRPSRRRRSTRSPNAATPRR